MAMGNWKIRAMKKGINGKSTKTKKSRIYYAYPPEDGWKGGDPEANGYRRKAG